MKSTDLSEGDPIVKDPPIHRTWEWLWHRGWLNGWFWGGFSLTIGWCGILALLILPFVGVINGTWYHGHYDAGNPNMALGLGALIGVIWLFLTGLWVWSFEEHILDERAKKEHLEVIQLHGYSAYINGQPYIPNSP